MCLLILILFYTLVIFSVTLGSIINNEIIRTIDISTSIMRMSIEITASNIVDDYEITFPQNLAQKMSFLNIEYNEKNLLLPAPTT